LYVDFVVHFSCKHKNGLDRVNAELTIGGDGTYDLKHKTFSNIQIKAEQIDFIYSDGSNKSNKS